MGWPVWVWALLRKEFLGCQTGAARDDRPYGAFQLLRGGTTFAMADYKDSAPLEREEWRASALQTIGSARVGEGSQGNKGIPG
jgi:hypothetical protein